MAIFRAGDVMDKYTILLRIGEGAHGVVYKAKHIESGEVVALKKVFTIQSSLVNLRKMSSFRNKYVIIIPLSNRLITSPCFDVLVG